MTTNREWLYALDVADLAAWFDAEHAEPNGGLAPVSSSSPIETGNKDSREKLEEDARDLQSRIWDAGSRHDGISMSHIIELLDRQAEITRRECEDAAWKANYKHMKARADKLQKQVDELKAEIVSLMQKKQPYTFNPEAPIENIKTICRYIDELTAERDRESEANRSHERVIAKLESERDALRIYRDSWVSKATVLEGDVDRLTAERDELREKLSQAIGYASDIIALQDLEVER